VRRASPRAVIAAAPAAATHTGSTPTTELSAKPASVRTSVATAKRGSACRAGGRARWRGRSSSVAKKRLSATHSTATTAIVGSAMSAAKRANDSSVA
jgi:hypothetical protein